MTIQHTDAFAFIDWDTARRCQWLPAFQRARIKKQGVQAQLAEVTAVVAAALRRMRVGRIKAHLRIYHGWHQGNQPTADHRALIGLPQIQSVFDGVLVAPPTISDRLACGGRHSQLRDTLRRRDDSADFEQKMVDTAIAADLLYLSRSRTAQSNSDFLILSEDDDMIPPVVVASHWGLSCKILRTRGPNRCMPNSAELLLPLEQADT
ncbi:hypothetical protein [Corallococcus sp. AB011P]|uniref:hypothetical protein n=1 Tax=Corallococcus sp. AB011P TaxID=2316735 RepID=UPI00131596C1|nr:hypothetical protein [Corallococcus sp. AB011P]